MTTIRKPMKKSFDEYKAIKDEIIEISEQRFKNILHIELAVFGKELRSELKEEMNIIRTELKEEINSVRTELRWLIGLMFIVLTIIMTIFKFLN